MESKSYKDVLYVNQKIYSDYADEYWQRTKNGHQHYLKEFIDEFIAELKGVKVYDLGCGPGRDLSYFISKGLDATGVDCSQGMVDICRAKKLPVIKDDFLSFDAPDDSVDGIWAYTSHTVIPKEAFAILLRKYARILKKDTGVLALGMIEGNYEGWKSDAKYDHAKRFVARYTYNELADLLSNIFGSVEITRKNVDGKIYLHCLCRNTKKADETDTANAAKNLFNKFSTEYARRTTGGITLLEGDRNKFKSLLDNSKTSGAEEEVTAIDIGCGPGRDVKLLSDLGIRMTGFDISHENVMACRNAGYEAVEGDIYNIRKYFPENSFDGAWCNCSVTNWILRKDLTKVLMYIKSIVKPNGYIFIGSVLGNFIGWEIDKKYDGLRRYNNHWDESELNRYLKIIGPCVYERKLINTGKKDYLNQVYQNVK